MVALQQDRAAALIEALVGLGVREFLVSPGSRSTPLVWALLQLQQCAGQSAGGARLQVTRLIDERCAGFYALGQARVTGEPSAVLCTSGTAPAHYYPAVIEAFHAQLPLIVVSGDRPAELVGCGAPQTIDQRSLFGHFAHYLEIPELENEQASASSLLASLQREVGRLRKRAPGPLHINFRARKPLEPDPSGIGCPVPTAGHSPPMRNPAPQRARPKSDPLQPVDEPVFDALAAQLRSAERPWLIAGASHVWQAPAPPLVERFARLSGCRAHFETTSQLRFALTPSFPHSHLVHGLEGLLEQRLAPDFVLQLGAPPMAPALQAMLSKGPAALRLAIAAASGNPDPFHRGALLLRYSARTVLEELCKRLESKHPPAGEPMPAPPAGSEAIDAPHSRQPTAETLPGSAWSEAAACQQLLQVIPRGSLLALGNSLAPRHLDASCPAQASGLLVTSQRGVNGIDGIVSGALGAAACFAGPATMLCGDITFLHDLGALWAADPARSGVRRAWPLVLVVLNNDGGRIFERLPLATHPAAQSGQLRLEPWLTPHGLGLHAAAQLWGIHYARASDASALRGHLELAYGLAGVHLIEARVDASSGQRGELPRAKAPKQP